MVDCAFCDFSQIADSTIASIRGMHIVASLGQITDGGYLLLVPMDHVSCIGAFSEEQVTTLDKVAEEVAFAMLNEYRNGITVFEHGIIGQTVPHAHMHLLPAMFDMTMRIKYDFPKSRIQKLENRQHLRELYQVRKEAYLFWSNPIGEFWVCWNPMAPKMYLRLIAAEMLGVPERGNWREMPVGIDREFRSETVRRLTPFFLK